MPRSPRMRVLNKIEWGGEPSQLDAKREIITNVELPAKYVMITATGTRPCVALEDCAILMRKYQRYFLEKRLPDMPFNFVVGPGEVALEGLGWHINALKYETEEKYQRRRVWNPKHPTKGFYHKLKDINALKDELGFKAPRTKEEDMMHTLEAMKRDEANKALGKEPEIDLNKHFGKTIIVALISEVHKTKNPSSRGLESALGLVKYGVENKYLHKNYKIYFNFEPMYRLEDEDYLGDTPTVSPLYTGTTDPREASRKARIQDFLEFMRPTMRQVTWKPTKRKRNRRRRLYV